MHVDYTNNDQISENRGDDIFTEDPTKSTHA